MEAPELAYLAPADDMRAALAPLRALASRHGVPLVPVADLDPADALAAILAAHAWSSSTVDGRSALDPLSGTGRALELTSALARVLLRAAGRPEANGRDGSWPPGRAPAGAAEPLAAQSRALAESLGASAVLADAAGRAADDLTLAWACPGSERLAAWVEALGMLSG